MPKNINYELIQSLYDQGFCDNQIAVKAKCGTSTVFQWRHKNNLPPNRAKGRSPKIDYAKAAKLYDACLTDAEIAEILGCAPSTIKLWRENLEWASNDELRELGVMKGEGVI